LFSPLIPSDSVEAADAGEAATCGHVAPGRRQHMPGRRQRVEPAASWTGSTGEEASQGTGHGGGSWSRRPGRGLLEASTERRGVDWAAGQWATSGPR
jgi:hypothetical protein